MTHQTDSQGIQGIQVITSSRFWLQSVRSPGFPYAAGAMTPVKPAWQVQPCTTSAPAKRSHRFSMGTCWLVGGIPTPPKNMKINWDDYSQYIRKKYVPNHQPADWTRKERKMMMKLMADESQVGEHKSNDYGVWYLQQLKTIAYHTHNYSICMRLLNHINHGYEYTNCEFLPGL